MKIRIEIICACCGNIFLVKPYRAETAKVCSRSCRARLVGLRPENRGPKPWAAKNLDGHRHKGNRFKNGHTPWNKGAKTGSFSKETEFQSGQKPHNYIAIGEVRIREDHGNPRAFVKVAEPNTWKLRSVSVWEEHNSKLPDGYVVHHVNRNTLDDAIENLEAMTRAAHAREHANERASAKAQKRLARGYTPTLFQESAGGVL